MIIPQLCVGRQFKEPPCGQDNRVDSPTNPRRPLPNPYTGYPPNDQQPGSIWSVDQFKSLLAFVRQGKIVDTLFDTFLFTGVSGPLNDVSGHLVPRFAD